MTQVAPKTMQEAFDLTSLMPDRTDEEWAEIDRQWREKQKQEEQQKAEKYLEQHRPKIFAETDIGLLPAAQPAIEQVLSWSPKQNRGLLLHGETGRGKTRLVWLLLEQLIRKGFRPLFFTSDQLSRELGESFAKRSHDDTLQRIYNRRILCIDDLGKEKPTQRWEEDLFSIIRERTDQARPTIITTNFVGQGLIERFNDPELAKPLVRRLREFSQLISC